MTPQRECIVPSKECTDFFIRMFRDVGQAVKPVIMANESVRIPEIITRTSKEIKHISAPVAFLEPPVLHHPL